MPRTLASFNRYKDIVLYRTAAGIKSEARQNYLGYLWFLFEPLLSTAVIYFAFTQISSHGGPPYVAFILLGTMAWQWFESSVMGASSTIREKYPILLQFDLPKFLFPAVTVMVNTWKFIVAYIVVLWGLPLLGYPPTLLYFELPLVIAVQLLLIFGLALPVALTVTVFNDSRALFASVFRLLFFVSGIFFDAAKVPADLRPAFFANPMAVIIDSYRAIVLRHESPDVSRLLYAVAFALVCLGAGLILHRRLDKRILKTIHA